MENLNFLLISAVGALCMVLSNNTLRYVKLKDHSNSNFAKIIVAGYAALAALCCIGVGVIIEVTAITSNSIFNLMALFAALLTSFFVMDERNDYMAYKVFSAIFYVLIAIHIVLLLI